MSIADHPHKAHGLADRAWSLLSRPRRTWDEIAGEPATTMGLLRDYVAPLAAIGPLAKAVNQLAFGARGALGLAYHPPVVETLGRAVFTWAFAILQVYVFALALEQMAPIFGGLKDRMQALKLSAYMGTAAWLAGAFLVLPRPFGALAILGLYSFYLLNLGIPRLLKVDGDRGLLLTVCGVIAAMAVFFAGQTLANSLLGPLFFVSKALGG
jgi:hypothetical protein